MNVLTPKMPYNRLLVFSTLILFIAALTGCSLLHKKPEPDGKPATALDLVFAALQMQRRDLGISRPLPQNDPFLLNKVGLFLRSPMQIHSFAQHIEDALDSKPCDLSSLISLSANIMEVDLQKDAGAAPAARLPAIENLPAPLSQAVETLYLALHRAKALTENTFAGLGAEEKSFITKQLHELLLQEARQKNISRREDQALMEKTFALAARVDLGKMLAAAADLAAAVDKAVAMLRRNDLSQIDISCRRETITISTPLGEIVIGGPGNNRYTGSMPLIVIDIGGDDRYAFTSYNPLSVIIDVSGNDLYEATTGTPMAAGIMGMGFLIDLSGNDRYIGENLSFGCGLLGIGVLLDERGNDVYRGRTFTEGAAALGVGILCDAAGNDEYQGSMYCQGFGFTGGCGLMLDYRGNDRFICSGGPKDFREQSGAYQSCSQGYGLGCRSFAAGGAGILYNGEGDDIYEGSYFCQGSSYWLSIGMLIDAQGNDRYQARRYSQGAGVHSSIGALVDWKGDDVYTSWAVSQGCGHDRSIGMLRDSRGNDRYTSDWLSQGSGNDSGIGLLIDEQGDDFYTAGADGSQGSGKYDERRDELSIGILVDAGGKNVFSGKGKNTRLWTSGQVGGGISGDGNLAAVWSEQMDRMRIAECGMRNTNAQIGVQGKKIQLNTQNSTLKTPVIVPELEGPLLTEDSWQKAADALAARAPGIISELFAYLDSKDVVVQRTLEETFKKIGEKNVQYLQAVVMDKNTASSRKIFLMYVLGDIAIPRSQELFLKMLDDQNPRIKAMALRGLYKLKMCPPDKEAKRMAKSDDADVRRYLALSLRCSDTSNAEALLEKLSQDGDFNVRYAAMKRMN